MVNELPSEPSLLSMMGLNLYKSSMDNHSCRDFWKAIAISCLDKSILQQLDKILQQLDKIKTKCSRMLKA